MTFTVSEIAEAVLAAAPPGHMVSRIVAIDGGGGAGKSTLALVLAAALGGAPIVPTDDFASWDKPLAWWPRLLDHVILPLAAGTVARYQRYDWTARRLADWVELPPLLDVVLIEGVSAMRQEFEPYLAYRIWIEAPRELRLNRGLDRDGEAMPAQWDAWMAAEDEYVKRDDPISRADAVLRGVASG